MKNITITKADIQQTLLERVNKNKPIAIILTVCALIAVASYPVHLIRYLNGTPFEYEGGVKNPPISASAAVAFVLPITIILLAFVAIKLYYADLYRVKKGRFLITEEPLCAKEKEFISYYRHIEKENLLYFRCGRVAVDKEVYSDSKIGDTFYVVTLSAKKGPCLAYNKKRFEINPEGKTI